MDASNAFISYSIDIASPNDSQKISYVKCKAGEVLSDQAGLKH